MQVNDAKMNEVDSLDTAWTWVGSTVTAVSVPLWLYIRSGTTFIIPRADATLQNDASITVAYWALLITAAGLAGLGAIALRYRRKAHRSASFGWPRFTLIESESRDTWVACGTFVAITIIPLAVFIASIKRYSDSRIALWHAHSPIAEGFFGSRLAAWRTPCDEQPCFRVHPLDDQAPHAIQWITWLTDPLVVLITLCAIVLWCRWAMTSLGNHPNLD